MKYSPIYHKSLIEACKQLKELEWLNDSSILITGSTGLIGSALVDIIMEANHIFKMNITVFAAGRSKKRFTERFYIYDDNPLLKFMEYDACHPVHFEFEPDYIIHCASNAHPRMYIEQPVETMLANILGMHYLLDYAKSHKTVKRILYVSSSEVYGAKKGNDLYREEDYYYLDILNSRACYPSGKRASETLCKSYVDEYGCNVVIVRPGHIYGATMTDTDSRAASQFIRDVLLGKDIIMKSAGLQLRSYCHVLDCASAIFTVLKEGICGEAYNISNPESVVTIRKFAEIAAKYSGQKIIFGEATRKEEKGYNLMSCSALDSSKLESLGWKGMYSAEEGIKNTLECLTE